MLEPSHEKLTHVYTFLIVHDLPSTISSLYPVSDSLHVHVLCLDFPGQVHALTRVGIEPAIQKTYNQNNNSTFRVFA